MEKHFTIGFGVEIYLHILRNLKAYPFLVIRKAYFY